MLAGLIIIGTTGPGHDQHTEAPHGDRDAPGNGDTYGDPNS